MLIVRYAFTGALAAAILALIAFVLVDTLVPHDSDERKAWLEFNVLMMGASGVAIGFAVGAIFGLVRTFTSKKDEENR